MAPGSGAPGGVGLAPSLSAAARELGVSRGALRDWFGRGCPGRSDEGIDLEAVRAWRAASLAPPRGDGAADEKTGDAARLLKAQADEKEWKAKLAELQHNAELGKFVPADEVRERDVQRIAVVRRELLAWAKSLPHKVVGLNEREIAVVLNHQVRQVLTRFSEM